MQSKTVKNYVYQTLYQLLTIFAPLITTPYISRVLGADGIGIYSYTHSVASMFIVFGAVGTTLYGQREVAYVQDDIEKRTRVFGEIILFRCITICACLTIYIPLFVCKGEYYIAYSILLIEILASVFDISWFFMGVEEFKITFVRNAIVKCLGIVLVFLFVHTEKDLYLYIATLTIPILIANVSLWLKVKPYLCLVSLKSLDLKQHIRPIILLFIPQIATEVYVIMDRIMLGGLTDTISEVAYYTKARELVKVGLLFVYSVGTVMLSAVSKEVSGGNQEGVISKIERSFSVVFMIGSAMCFGLCGTAKKFIPFYLGEGFSAVTPLMYIISPIILIVAVSNVTGNQYLLPTKQQGAYTASVVSGAIVNLVLNLVLIPHYGAIGASVATVIAEIVVTSAQCIYLRKQIEIGKCLRKSIKYIFAGVIMCAVVVWIGGYIDGYILCLVVQVVVGASLYALLLFTMKDEVFGQFIIGIRNRRRKH